MAVGALWQGVVHFHLAGVYGQRSCRLEGLAGGSGCLEWASVVGVVFDPRGRPMDSRLRLLGGVGPPIEGQGWGGWCGGVVERWREVWRMRIQFPLGSGSRDVRERAVVAARVERGVSGQGDHIAIRGEGFAEDRVASRQGWAGLPVSTRCS